MKDAVGPVLRMSSDVDAIVAAIREDNPDQEVEVVDRGAYVRVQTPGFMRLTRKTLAEQVGRDYELRELEALLASFAGRIRTSSDEIVWALETRTA